jgi:hypothetical protein
VALTLIRDYEMTGCNPIRVATMPSLDQRVAYFLERIPRSGNSAQCVAETCKLLGSDQPDRTARGEAFTDWLVTMQAAKRLRRESDMTEKEWVSLRAILVVRHVQAWGEASAAT